MVHQYIAGELLRKNRGVYFKKGKWVLHILFLVLAAVTLRTSANDPELAKIYGPAGYVAIGCTMLLFALFFYIYCLYLIPACFKGGRYRQFWIMLTGMLLIFPLANTGLQKAVLPLMPAFRYLGRISTWQLARESYASFIGYFLGFTDLLYIMELLEGVRTAKEIRQHDAQLQETETQLIKTRMDPAFVVRSLDGITRLAAGKREEAPDSVISFSDILRYRLYRSAGRLVPLTEELQQLGNLIRFHNAIHGTDALCTLEVAGSPGEKGIPPLALINMAEPLLNLYEPGTGWSLLLYLLIEEEEIQVAAELSAGGGLPPVAALLESNLHSIFGSSATFTMETEGTANSIRICLPIQSSLTASL